MKKRFLKVKAIFQIIVFVMSMFSVYLLNAKDVKAQEQNVCCAKTKSDEYCVYTEESNCDIDYYSNNLASTCDQTSYCKPVCCYNSDNGECNANVGAGKCQADGLDYFQQVDCDVNECQKGCCTIGTNFIFTTEQNCIYETSKFPDLSVNFNLGIDNEADCVMEKDKLEEGCCVLSDGTCSYGYGDDCSSFSSGGFNAGKYCSVLSSEGKCGQCTSHDHKECYQDDVYWLDSCGNREDKAEDCDYDAGTICGEVNNDFVCKDINCATTYDTPNVDYDGVARKNGESWCSYDGKVGPGMDLVGSRHYRHLCVNGVELTEPCRDKREEFCIQGGVTGTDTGDFSEASCMTNRWEDCASDCNEADPSDPDTFQEKLKEDKECCEDNSKRDCVWLGANATELNPVQEDSSSAITDSYLEWNITNISCEGLTTSNCEEYNPLLEEAYDVCGEEVLGGPAPTSEGEEKNKCSFYADNGTVYDCLNYKSISVSCYREQYNDTYDTSGKCVPLIPPGLDFWDDESDAESVCEQANTDCKVIYKCKKSVSLTKGVKKSYECKENCDCRESRWVNSMNAYCRSLGDCGAHYNIAGEFTEEGYHIGASGKDTDVVPGLDMSEIGDFDEWTKTDGLTLNYLDVSAPEVGGLMESITKWGTLAIAGIGVTYIGLVISNIALDAGFIGASVSNAIGVATLQETAITSAYEATGASTLSTFGAFIQALGVVLFWLAVFMVIFDWLFGECDPAEAVYEFECKPWEQPDGGDNCDKCIEQFRVCDEYRCKSLGKSCEIVNEGYSNVACERSADYDTTSPVISPDKDYYDSNGININEISNSFEITSEIDAFSPVTIAINTDKWAKCKYSDTVNIEYEDMPEYITDYPPILKEHNTTLRWLQNGKSYEYYIRCENKDGYSNNRDYKVSFKINPGIDHNVPLIRETSIADGSYIAYNKNSTLLDIFVEDDNSVECKWSRSNVDFDNMNSEFGCFANRIDNYFECSTNLTNIEVGKNTFYFACKDCASYGEGDVDLSTLEVGDVLPDVCNASERNAMQPIPFNLYGSNKLKIDSTAPSGTLYYNDVTLMVSTSGGAMNGKATCGFDKEDKSFFGMSEFYSTNSTTHTQSLVNLSGNVDGVNYLYYVKCQDNAGNDANSTIQFTVAVDTAAPNLLYLYKDASLIHVILNEASNCQYSGSSFVYGNGTAMSGDGTTEHTVSLGGPYHIMCKDLHDNLIKFSDASGNEVDEFVIY